ncbi:MAG: hypothetical protein C0518_01730 [Opitutus sp.]|nr:hypothetical protein [Opitutus sp.]
MLRNMILEILLGAWAILLGWFAWSCFRAPVGFEDRDGFHLGTERAFPVRDLLMPRSRGRRRERQRAGHRSLA